MSGDDFETPSSEAWGDIPRLLRRWGTPNLGASMFLLVCLFFVLHVWSSLTICSLPFAVKKRPKLKSKYQERLQKAIEYSKSIESWDDLLDPQTLAFYCLGPDPSPYVLRSISIEEKKSKCLLRPY